MLCTLTFLQRQSALSVWLPVPIVTFKFYFDSLIIVWVYNECAWISMEVHIMAHFWMSEDYNWTSVLSCHCGIQGLNKGHQVGSRWFYTESSGWPRNPIFELKIRGEIKAKDFSSFWNYQCKKLCQHRKKASSAGAVFPLLSCGRTVIDSCWSVLGADVVYHFLTQVSCAHHQKAND